MTPRRAIRYLLWPVRLAAYGVLMLGLLLCRITGARI
jgi:hypothetical protein